MGSSIDIKEFIDNNCKLCFIFNQMQGKSMYKEKVPLLSYRT